MYKKHIEHFITVSLKYFFDFDYTILSNATLIVLVVAGSCRFLFCRMAEEFQDGLATVQKDVSTLKAGISTAREGWENSELNERMLHNARSLKNNLLDKLLAPVRHN